MGKELSLHEEGGGGPTTGSRAVGSVKRVSDGISGRAEGEEGLDVPRTVGWDLYLFGAPAAPVFMLPATSTPSPPHVARPLAVLRWLSPPCRTYECLCT